MGRKLGIAGLCLLFVVNLSVGSLYAQGMESVIVGFKDTPEGDLIQQHGGNAKLTIVSANAIAATLPVRAVSALRAHPRVAYVEIDGEAYTCSEPKEAGNTAPVQPPQSLPWGIDRIDADLIWWLSTGSGTKVAVIDTGIDNSHPDLSGRVVLGPTYVIGTKSSKDDNGHGTHVAGTIGAVNNSIGVVGVAPNTTLYAVKVLDRNGSGYWSSVAAGIDWAAANGMRVVNMSLGGGYSATVETACLNAEGKGVLLIAAAGNSGNAVEGSSTVIFPAKFPTVVAVSATDSADAIASFSSTGPEVELAAPGKSISSTWLKGAYATLNGTSMAAPHVAGAAALVIAKGVADANGNGRTNDEVRALLNGTAEDLGALGRDAIFGNGLVDAEKAVNNAQ